VKLTPGVDFTIILWAAFRGADQKMQNKTECLTVFFVLLGFAHVIAAHKMLICNQGHFVPTVSKISNFFAYTKNWALVYVR